MQAISEQFAEDHHHTSNLEVMAQNFEHSVRLSQDLGTQKTKIEAQESFDDAPQKSEQTNSEDQESFHDAEEEEEEFSFTLDGGVKTPITAEDAFLDGQIRSTFPVFNQDLLSEQRYFAENLTGNPNVKKVLVEMNKQSEEISGPCCEWNAERETCKKSYSTGFSKLLRLRDLVIRSNSDGRDAFVFLNNTRSTKPTKASSSHQNSSSFKKKLKEDEKKDKNSSSFNLKKDEKKAGIGGGKKKTTSSSSAHEVYLKNKAKENNGRKKSYLPYRPEGFGFFTNVNGGISKNVHPY